MRSMRSRAGQVRGALADVVGRHVAADVVEGVDRLARPVGVAKLLLGQQQHPAALPPALAQELVALPVGGDAEERQGHLGQYSQGSGIRDPGSGGSGFGSSAKAYLNLQLSPEPLTPGPCL